MNLLSSKLYLSGVTALWFIILSVKKRISNQHICRDLCKFIDAPLYSLYLNQQLATFIYWSDRMKTFYYYLIVEVGDLSHRCGNHSNDRLGFSVSYHQQIFGNKELVISILKCIRER